MHYLLSADEIIQLRKTLNDHNAVLGIRAHINRNSTFTLNENELLDLSQNRYYETQIILRVADVLITDYSSIWVDYLLMNRPIIGFCYDWDEFMQDRGLIYDYKQIFPGQITYKITELMEAIGKIINDDIADEYKFKHQNARFMFHEYDDGNASQRVFDEICKIQRKS